MRKLSELYTGKSAASLPVEYNDGALATRCWRAADRPGNGMGGVACQRCDGESAHHSHQGPMQNNHSLVALQDEAVALA